MPSPGVSLDLTYRLGALSIKDKSGFAYRSVLLRKGAAPLTDALKKQPQPRPGTAGRNGNGMDGWCRPAVQ